MTLMASMSEVRQHLVMKEMIDLMEAGFVAFANGGVEMPHRIRLNAGDNGYAAFMPCYMPSHGLGIKINTNFNQNPTCYGLPRILGLLILLDTRTGMPLAIMDSTVITACRTAAVSGVAMRHLARSDAETLGVLGTGTLCLPHIQAASAVRQIRLVRVYSPHLFAHEEEFARIAEEIVETKVIIAKSAEEVVTGADILVTCTSSEVPVLDGRWISQNACVVAVGNARPNSRELDTLTVLRSSIVCDSWKSCILESGDLLIPLKEGCIKDDHVRVDLGRILQGKDKEKLSSGVVLFKSVGLAFEDLIALRYVYTKMTACAVGTSFKFFDMPAQA